MCVGRIFCFSTLHFRLVSLTREILLLWLSSSWVPGSVLVLEKMKSSQLEAGNSLPDDLLSGLLKIAQDLHTSFPPCFSIKTSDRNVPHFEVLGKEGAGICLSK